MASYDVGRAGERAVVEWLKGNGYQIIEWDTRAPGATDIEANSRRHVLIQVKSAAYPNLPATLSTVEERLLKLRAVRKRAEAWEAKVQFSQDLSKYNGPHFRPIT